MDVIREPDETLIETMANEEHQKRLEEAKEMGKMIEALELMPPHRRECIVRAIAVFFRIDLSANTLWPGFVRER